MNQKLKKTIIVLHISAVINFLLSIALLTILSGYTRIAPFIALVSIGMGVFVEIVIKGLKDNKFWAWVYNIVF
jgi:hypothetical protein